MASPNAKKRVIDLLKGTLATTGYYGLGDLVANTDDLIAQIYTSPTYSDTDRANIALTFSRRPIPVLGEYPRTTTDLPCVFVFRTGDGETAKGVIGGNFGINEDLTTTEQETTIYGTWMGEQVMIAIWASKDPGTRDDLYLAVREIFLRGRDYFDAADIKQAEWSSGKDGQLYRENAEPQIVHTAEATIKYETPVTWTSQADKVLDVRTNLIGSNGGQVTVEEWEEEFL